MTSRLQRGKWELDPEDRALVFYAQSVDKGATFEVHFNNSKIGDVTTKMEHGDAMVDIPKDAKFVVVDDMRCAVLFTDV